MSYCYYCDDESNEDYITTKICNCKDSNLHKKCYYIIRFNSSNCFYCKASFPPLEYDWNSDGIAKVYKFKNNHENSTIYRHEFTINRSMEKHGIERIYDDIRGHLVEEINWVNGLRVTEPTSV